MIILILKRNRKMRLELSKAGSILVANLNLWYAGAKNINGKSRKVIMLNIKIENMISY